MNDTQKHGWPANTPERRRQQAIEFLGKHPEFDKLKTPVALAHAAVGFAAAVAFLRDNGMYSRGNGTQGQIPILVAEDVVAMWCGLPLTRTMPEVTSGLPLAEPVPASGTYLDKLEGPALRKEAEKLLRNVQALNFEKNAKSDAARVRSSRYSPGNLMNNALAVVDGQSWLSEDARASLKTQLCLKFEVPDPCLPAAYLMVRLNQDGQVTRFDVLSDKNPTTMRGEFYACLWTFNGDRYEDALKQAHAFVLAVPTLRKLWDRFGPDPRDFKEQETVEGGM